MFIIKESSSEDASSSEESSSEDSSGDEESSAESTDSTVEIGKGSAISADVLKVKENVYRQYTEC